MKNNRKIVLVILSILVLAACADDKFAKYVTEKPQNLAQYEYLNTYDALKTYVDRNVNPNFKLGMGVSVSDFLEKGLVYSLANSNFDEMTAGNAMKYSSCVADDGSMDFSQVTKFVDAAKGAGLTIYGHTLAWHSQQNNKYLNGLIADKTVEPNPDSADPALHMKTSAPQSNVWDWQIFYMLSEPLTIGQEYTISMRIKGSSATEIPFWPNTADGSQVQYLSSFTAGEQWSTSSITFIPNIPIQKLVFSFGLFGGDLYFDDVTLTATGSDNNLIANGSFGEDDLSYWSKPSWHGYSFDIEKVMESATVLTDVYVVQDDFSSGTAMMGWGNGSTRQVVNGVFEMTNPSEVNSWEAQAGYDFSGALTEGTTYFLKMKIKGNVNGSIGASFQKPEGYAGRGDFPSIPVTTEWQEITVSTNCTGDATTRFLFNYGKYVGTIYIDDLAIYWQKSSNSIPLTPEEKEDTLTWAMDKWISGMMEACNGYVTAWDVVNEPISGKDVNGDGYYELQSVTQGTVSENDAQNNFYWQDYLGDEDYVRTAVRLARRYFAEYGGNSSELKLFINDYNLESDWDGNKKLKSLIKWIEKWEADGVTKIDGIGTQMHVSYYMNPTTQQSTENAIVEMFELLAATGKLVKISELDMGLVDDGGNSVLTENVTEEQHKAMAEFYKFIIEKYFEIIPVEQRYGITQWAATDSPTDSSWRKGQPIGLWNLNYNRKHTYAGFADGLAGK
ncbi:MAG: endo-1,4-beta-xylanase [Bacteroides sp.]|nr:endo-1,4-beta-xylanase [Bacteroides sp.]MCI1681915.1 endo-1,4-beta-xylanase [Bacteroides sp.]